MNMEIKSFVKLTNGNAYFYICEVAVETIFITSEGSQRLRILHY